MADFDTLAAEALSSAFATLGKDASYAPPVGVSVACRIIQNKADDQMTIGETALLAAQDVIEVRASEVASPAKGGRFSVSAQSFIIVAAPRREDSLGLVWTCLCRQESA